MFPVKPMKPKSNKSKFLIGGVILVAVLAYCFYLGGGWTIPGALLLLGTAGGAIAYLGDIIGYTWGKKRYTLFGLRPKNTAQVAGVAAGVVSAWITFGVLCLLSAGFREALYNGTELVKNNLSLKHANRALATKIYTSTAAANKAIADRDAAKNDADVAQRTLTSEREQLNVAKTALSSARGDLGKVQVDLNKAERNLNDRQAALDKAAHDLQTARVTVQVAQHRGDELQTANAVALQRLNNMTSEAIPTIEKARSRDIVYRDGQEVGRTVIQSGTASNALLDLSTFLDQLSGKAETAGASKGSSIRAVKLATIQVKSSDGHGSQPQFAGESESLQALADQIHDAPNEGIVVVATAVGNCFTNERVVLQLRPYRNRLAIAAGTVLGASDVHVGDSFDPNTVMDEIRKLLVTKVRPAAIDAGVIPVAQSSHTPADFGDLSLQDILTVMHEVEAVKSDATVTVSAAKDVYAADQLTLSFTVKPAAIAATTTAPT